MTHASPAEPRTSVRFGRGPGRPVRSMAIIGLCLAWVTADVRADDAAGDHVSSADIPGPELSEAAANPSHLSYNRAVRLYLDGHYGKALDEMRAAVRARRFGQSASGLAFSNLCLMYLRVGKYKNAQAACTKALTILPGYVPATLNLARAKRRAGPGQ